MEKVCTRTEEEGIDTECHPLHYFDRSISFSVLCTGKILHSRGVTTGREALAEHLF